MTRGFLFEHSLYDSGAWIFYDIKEFIRRSSKISFNMSPLESNNDKGVTGAAKFATSTLGNTVGGLGRTVGGVVGAGGRGLGQTITAATGSSGKPVGDALENLGNGVESGAKNVSKGVEDAGKWK